MDTRTLREVIADQAVEIRRLQAALEAAQTENDHLSNLYMCAETITPEGELGITPETVRRELKRLSAPAAGHPEPLVEALERWAEEAEEAEMPGGFQ